MQIACNHKSSFLAAADDGGDVKVFNHLKTQFLVCVCVIFFFFFFSVAFFCTASCRHAYRHKQNCMLGFPLIKGYAENMVVGHFLSRESVVIVLVAVNLIFVYTI